MNFKNVISSITLVLFVGFMSQINMVQARGFGGGGHMGGGHFGGGHMGGGHAFHGGGHGGHGFNGHHGGYHGGHNHGYNHGNHNGYWRNGYGYGYWNDAGLWIPLAVGAGIGAAAVASESGEDVCDEGQYFDPNTGECVPADQDYDDYYE